MAHHTPPPGPVLRVTRAVSLVVAVLAGTVFLVLLVISSTGTWSAPLPQQAFVTGGVFLVAAGATLLHLRTPRAASTVDRHR